MAEAVIGSWSLAMGGDDVWLISSARAVLCRRSYQIKKRAGKAHHGALRKPKLCGEGRKGAATAGGVEMTVRR